MPASADPPPCSELHPGTDIFLKPRSVWRRPTRVVSMPRNRSPWHRSFAAVLNIVALLALLAVTALHAEPAWSAGAATAPCRICQLSRTARPVLEHTVAPPLQIWLALLAPEPAPVMVALPWVYRDHVRPPPYSGC